MNIEIEAAHRIPPEWNRTLTGAAHFWLRLDHYPGAGITARCSGAPAGATPSWTVTGLAGAAVVAPSNGPACPVARPAAPARIDIVCTAGAETARATLWAIAARIVFHNHGQVSHENERWRASARLLGLPTNHRPRLGLHTWPDPQDGSSRRYGAFLEIAGAIEPRDVPVPFHLCRRTVHAHTEVSHGPNFAPPERDDTTHRSLQDTSLSATGRVYDLDAPGAQFASTDPLGARHNWDLLFEEMVVIGPLDAGARPACDRAEAHHRIVSPPRRWRAHFNAQVASAGAPPSVEMHGYVGP